MYVRFGEVPRGERSELLGLGVSPNGARHPLYAPGAGTEEGVSVFGVAERADGTIVVDTGGGKNADLRLVFSGFFLEAPHKARRIFRVWGEEVGAGAGGEPLLRGCVSEEVPLTTAVVLDSWGSDARYLEQERIWNRWRYLDGTREGHRTRRGGENFQEACVTGWAAKLLHEANEKKWRKIRAEKGA